jgi:hypothetical protein
LKHDIGEGEVGEAVFHPAYAGYVEGYLGIVNGGPPARAIPRMRGRVEASIPSTLRSSITRRIPRVRATLRRGSIWPVMTRPGHIPASGLR